RRADRAARKASIRRSLLPGESHCGVDARRLRASLAQRGDESGAERQLLFVVVLRPGRAQAHGESHESGDASQEPTHLRDSYGFFGELRTSSKMALRSVSLTCIVAAATANRFFSISARSPSAAIIRI